MNAQAYPMRDDALHCAYTFAELCNMGGDLVAATEPIHGQQIDDRNERDSSHPKRATWA